MLTLRPLQLEAVLFGVADGEDQRRRAVHRHRLVLHLGSVEADPQPAVLLDLEAGGDAQHRPPLVERVEALELPARLPLAARGLNGATVTSLQVAAGLLGLLRADWYEAT